jgi:hypothetical protein
MLHDELILEINNKTQLGAVSNHEFWINVPRAYPVISIDKLGQLEKENGLVLPLLLKRIYSEIGNGGQTLGPGILGFACKNDPRRNPPNNETRGAEDDSLDYYEWFSEIKIQDKEYKVLPICEWGDNMWSCVVLNNTSFPVYFYDGSKAEYDEEDEDISDNCWELEAETIEDWFEKWVKGIKLNRS